MNRDKLMLLLASMATLVLGPGAGHLVLREWKKAVFFITLALVLFLILGMNFISEVGQEALKSVKSYENLEQFKNLYYGFQENNPKMILFFDVFFSALWAYSVVDLFMIAKNKEIFKKEK